MFRTIGKPERLIYIRLGSVPWGCLIRASQHSLELLQDICQASFDPDQSPRWDNSPENYHDTLQWLRVGNHTVMCLALSALNYFQAFPDPPQDVIEVWEQYLIVASRHYEYRLRGNPQYDLETRWRRWQANYGKWFPHHTGQNRGN
jgi:hypothetical protein